MAAVPAGRGPIERPRSLSHVIHSGRTDPPTPSQRQIRFQAALIGALASQASQQPEIDLSTADLTEPAPQNQFTSYLVLFRNKSPRQ